MGKTLSKLGEVSTARTNSSVTCLRLGWQPVFRRHEHKTGFGKERGNLPMMILSDQALSGRDGATRSSDEASVIEVERRGCVIWLDTTNQPRVIWGGVR
jgi:hypothetical protein